VGSGVECEGVDGGGSGEVAGKEVVEFCCCKREHDAEGYVHGSEWKAHCSFEDREAISKIEDRQGRAIYMCSES
jgi:hypothetical protein